MTIRIGPISIPAVIVILLITAGVFGVCLFHDFVWDDWVLMVPNPVYLEFDLRGMLLAPANSVEYLPVRDLSIALDALIWGMTPFGFHLSNLVFYLLSLVFLYAAVTRLAQLFNAPRPETLAFWTTLLFALHPLHVEVVNFIGARNSILAGLFLFLSLTLSLKSLQENQRGLIWWALLCYACATLSKAIVVFYPLFLALLLWLVPGGSAARKTRAWHLAGFVAVTIGMVAIHLKFAGESGFANEEILRFGVESEWFQIRKALLITLFYTRMSIVPYPLTVEYPVDFIFQASLLHQASALGLLILAGVSIWTCRRNHPLAALGLAWFYIALIPVLNLFPTHPVIADRYAYLAVLGFALLCAYLIAATGRTLKHIRVIAVLLVALASGVSLARSLDWRSDLSLWQEAVKAYPDTGHLHLAQAMWNRGMPTDALQEFRSAGKHYYSFYAGKMAMMNGQTERAIADFNRALAEGGDAESEVHLSLAKAYEASGDTRLALDHYLKTLRSENPDIFGTHRQTAQAAIDAIWMNMGPQVEAVRRRAMENADDFVSQAQAAEFFLSIGKYDDAKGLYTGALSLQPSSWQAWHNLGLTHMKSSDCERAIEAFEKGLAINPGNISSLNNLGHCHGKLNQTEQAVRSYERALEIDPVFFSAAFNLGRLHFAEGDREKAQEYLLLALEMTSPGDPYRSRIDTYLKQIDGY